MIEVKDLRIGDIVMYGDHIVTILGININGTICLMDGKEEYHADVNMVNPIPLSYDFFSKNGWGIRQIDEHDFSIYKDDVYLEWCDIDNSYTYSDFYHFGYYITLKYVHQLQHIFWVRGIETRIRI